MGKKWKQRQTILLGSKITVDNDCSHEIKRHLLLGRKAMTNLDSILKSSESESHSVVSDSLQPHGLYSPWNSPGQNIGVGSLSPSPEHLPNPGIKSRSPALQADSLPAEPQGKPFLCLSPFDDHKFDFYA